ncbi:4-alpha-glucanotransferase [Enhygromyxa salina]|uniref:4-alpha-glucanotransferase n=1 Tax=Enhygromyxa salina TaxID=215803 RepID=A0A2S9YT54_9BACT|nr:4-alpha-glucanotransferase [Enhygromyxa salina]PRQ08274.1 4-alpha-glucanotransferase [Enhygromyxa salina]
MTNQRASGVLLHPTSLPGPHGIGDLGPSARHFVEWLVSAGQRLWQVLPLNPVGAGNSPYASVSVFAGSPLLVALEPLIEAGWLAPPHHDELAQFNPHRVDFERVIPWRMAKLREAAAGFFAHASPEQRAAFAAYAEAEASWLDDYALFMTLDGLHQPTDGTFVAWTDWPPALARREAAALAAAREQHRDEVTFWCFVQYCFDQQWRELKRYANERDVQIIGDLPIFVAGHGADCWSRPDLYLLAEDLTPRVVAGVPPDFFSKTGQRWGNPLYDWDAMARDGYAWWVARARRQLALADLIRVDHFRGFASYWEIPASSPLATDGHWVPGPGAALFEALEAALGELPVIAEDLGVITKDVETLRDQLGLPGMKVLQFAFFDDATHPFLPHNYPENCVVYTGTHDNDTVRGWYEGALPRDQAFARAYLGCGGHDLHWAMIRAASASPARLAIYQFQDVLGLDGAHRMNVPGQTECWTWRFGWETIGGEPAWRLLQLSAAHGRAPLERLSHS